MPSSANRSDYIPDNVFSDRKPPASESSPSNPNSKKPPSSVNTLHNLSSESRAVSSTRTDFPVQERLLNAREVAMRLGVSERWVRDHTTRRFPKLRGVKLGTLMRYRGADVEDFMEKLATSRSSLQPRFGG